MKTLLILVALGCLVAVARTQMKPQCKSQAACTRDECCAKGSNGDTCIKRQAEGKICDYTFDLVKSGTGAYPVCPCARTLLCVPNTDGSGGTCIPPSPATWR